MSQQEDDLRSLAKIMDMLRGISIVLVVANIYWFCHSLVGEWQFHPQTMKVLTGLDNAGGVFHNVWNAKWWSLLLLALSCFGTKGVKNEKIRWSQIWLFLSIGAALFFLNWWMVSAGLLLLYIITSVAGYVCLLLAGVWMSRLLKNNMMDDRFNEENESFMQEMERKDNEYSVNLPTRFYYKKKWNKGLPLTEFDFMQKYRESFRQSELGRIYEQLPLKELAKAISSKMPPKKPQGNKPMFPPEGEVALMFLKPYTGLSDDGLVEMLNGSLHMQMFCGILIDPLRPLKDGKIVSAIRNRLAHYIDMKELQKVLFDKWKGGLTNLDRCLSDATCYESFLRFPTDVKLLWEACAWLHSLMKKTCKELGERLPRNKYNDVDKARLAHARQRKPKKNATRKLQRRLLSLLGKMLGQWSRMQRQFQPAIHLTTDQERRLMTIRNVLCQQRDHFNHKEVKHRIVSIDRPYIRPIKRGKENKPTEFGAKVNNIQIDGISFIEHHSFEAFNEGIRVRECVEYHKELTGVDVREFGGDTIYANNAARKYCTEHGITTCFARKGPRPKDEAADDHTARRILGNLRSTVMEGSFGNQKQHFGVGRIAARNRHSETLLLFFGIHMANAATLAARKLAKEERDIHKEEEYKLAIVT